MIMGKKKSRMPVESVAAPSKISTEDKARMRRYEAEDAIRTLQRADEIRRDKDLCKDMKALAKEQMEALKKVAK